jgi:hypothetical protein
MTADVSLMLSIVFSIETANISDQFSDKKQNRQQFVIKIFELITGLNMFIRTDFVTFVFVVYLTALSAAYYRKENRMIN